jgi:group I intron endonuclease
MRVYLVTNRVNGKRYVGITTKTLAQRWYEHCWLAEHGGTQALYKAIRKHDPSSFTVEQIDTAESLEELLEKERSHINRLATYAKLGTGYNMTLGGDGVFGFEFDVETRHRMAAKGRARFSDPKERALQRLRQSRYWNHLRRTEQSARIKEVHAKDPEQSCRHSKFMKSFSDSDQMRKRARLFWDSPGAKDRFKARIAAYWSDPANRAKRSAEIKQRFAGNPTYAVNVSRGKKKHFQENPDTARRHSDFMKKRFAENPELVSELRERAYRLYAEDPTLIRRMVEARKRFWERNPQAREALGTKMKERAVQRRAIRTELVNLASEYKEKTGQVFSIPSRSEGGWQSETMFSLIDELKRLLQTL